MPQCELSITSCADRHTRVHCTYASLYEALCAAKATECAHTVASERAEAVAVSMKQTLSNAAGVET